MIKMTKEERKEIAMSGTKWCVYGVLIATAILTAVVTVGALLVKLFFWII